MNAKLETAIAQMDQLERERLAEVLGDLVAHVKGNAGNPFDNFSEEEIAELQAILCP